MSEPRRAYATTPIEPGDPEAGFACGKRALDDYFARHALANDAVGIGRAYVLRREPGESVDLPTPRSPTKGGPKRMFLPMATAISALRGD